MRSELQIKTEEYRGYTIELSYDDCPESPREWDNVSKMVFKHRRHNFPNDAEIRFDDFNSWNAIAKYLEEEEGAIMIYPVRMYEHSMIAFSLSSEYPFNDPWDSGTVGLIYTTRKDMENIMGIKRLTRKNRQKVFEALKQDLHTYEDYVEGRVYGYIIKDRFGNVIDSCWGYYGEYGEYAMQEARSIIDNHIGYEGEHHEELYTVPAS